MKKKVLILINTGTPDSYYTSSVRSYLSQFLNDRRVIDMPFLLRLLLVNLIIIPFRAPVSAKKYKSIWTGSGSPLLVNMKSLTEKLHKKLSDEYVVFGAMRYGNPSIKNVLARVRDIEPESVKIFPLYPHYASSTTGSVIEYVMKTVRKWEAFPEISFAGQFYSHPLYIESVVKQVIKHDLSKYDHILFSYHGLPEKQIEKIHPATGIRKCNCETEMPEHGTFCYRATSYETTRLLAGKLKLSGDLFSTSFQSRFSSAWLAPFTDSVLKELARNGKKRVLVVSPSFTADCLETLHEIEAEYRELFCSLGGESLDLVSSLNDDDSWVDAIIEIAGL